MPQLHVSLLALAFQTEVYMYTYFSYGVFVATLSKNE